MLSDFLAKNKLSTKDWSVVRAAFEIDTVVESNEAYDNSNFLVFLKGGRKYSGRKE